MAKKSYTVKTPVNHSNEDFAVGDLIELDDKTDAPPLLAVDAIEEAPKKGAAK